MHTVEHETPAHGPLARLRKLRFMQSEDTMIATLASWSVGLALFTLAGFYIGTIAGHQNHPGNGPSASMVASTAPAGSIWREPGALMHKDLDPTQLGYAIPYAAVGLLIGLVFALLVTFKYVPDKLRELEREQGAH